MPSTVIDFRRHPPYVASAALWSILAYPGDNEFDERNQLHKDLTGYALRTVDVDEAFVPKNALEAGWLMRAQESAKSVKPLIYYHDRIRHRCCATNMAMPFLMHDLGRPVRLPPNMKTLTMRAARKACSLDERTDTKNVKTRYWRPSLPVLHLACAYSIIGQEHNLFGEDFSQLAHITDRALIAAIILKAAALRPYVLARWRSEIDDTRCWRIEVAA
jgi:hypothetical protein